MNIDTIISYVNLGGMIVAPIGFFFWVKFKIGEYEKVITEMKLNFKEEMIQVKASKTSMKRELESRIKEYKQDQKEVNDGLKNDIIGLRGDISQLKTDILTAINNINK